MSRRARFAQLLAAAVVAGTGSSAVAALIGVNFNSAAGTLAPTDVAGAPGVAQANYNNVAGASGTSLALVDNAGAATTATLTFTSSGVFNSTANTPAGPDETLFKGFIFGNSTVTVNNIGAALLGTIGPGAGRFDLYVYTLNDSNRTDQVTLTSGATSGESHFVLSPGGGNAGYVDGSAGTPFTYLVSQSQTSAGAVTGSDYTIFTGLQPTTGGGLTNGVSFSVTAPGNGFLTGFQIAPSAVPEPASLGLLGLAATGLLTRRRRC